MRKQMFEEMEEKLRAGKSPEDSLFYYHPSEDRIVLSHALFWVMTQSLKGKIGRRKYGNRRNDLVNPHGNQE